ncbi:acyltransferase family protein [Methyloferula stellata]|uniref:acyltransferase family protein n=1 Tax=Methyloferula stellata TaxID=876270 RepID=UPI0003733756|nr:acyltransferase family protein [Methyloferula stellata]
MAEVRFRSDINGLRALAVTAVVLFHLKLGFVHGGFAGVDVFFVISGYLMTLIITRRMAKGSFSLIGFYRDRARRIVPPLYGMIFGLFVFGYFFIDLYDYQKLGSTGISALLFFSNFRFWEATGYFDTTSATKWLLHTWSLSVEWQFYLIYPIILMALNRFVTAQRWRLIILWSLTILSLAACIACSTAHPASTFYLLPFRAWEMLAGGLVALQFDKAPNDKRLGLVLLIVGLALIVIACLTLDAHRPWPYYWAIIPVTGTCLVIVARQTETVLFANPVSSFLGAWSYSIYLWHWPLIVAWHYLGFDGTPLIDFGALPVFKIIGEASIVAALIGLGYYLWTLYPKLSASLRRRLETGSAIGAFALTLLFAAVITVSHGLAQRLPDGLHAFEAYNKAISDWTYPARCAGAGPDGALRPCHAGADKPDVLFIGDSFAMQLYPRFKDAAALHDGRSFTFLTAAGCPALLGVERNDGPFNCAPFVEKAFELAESGGYRRVVLISNWSEYFYPFDSPFCFTADGSCVMNLTPSANSEHLAAAFARTTSRLAALKKRGLDLVIISSTPFGRFDVPIELAKRRFFGRKTDDVEFVDRSAFEVRIGVMKSLLKTMAEAVGATFVDPLPYLCDARRCATIDGEGVSLFADTIHYRSEAVKSSRFDFLNGVIGLTQAAR